MAPLARTGPCAAGAAPSSPEVADSRGSGVDVEAGPAACSCSSLMACIWSSYWTVLALLTDSVTPGGSTSSVGRPSMGGPVMGASGAFMPPLPSAACSSGAPRDALLQSPLLVSVPAGFSDSSDSRSLGTSDRDEWAAHAPCSSVPTARTGIAMWRGINFSPSPLDTNVVVAEDEVNVSADDEAAELAIAR